MVLVFREYPMGFSGPCTIVSDEAKTVSIMDGNTIKPYSRAQLKKYKEPAEIQESLTELVPRSLDL
jgi:hypothetical protein